MKKILYFAAALCLGLSLASCADDIVIDHVDEGAYANIENLVATLRGNHIKRVRDGKCTVYAGLTFLDILVNIERISDQCSNLGVYTLSMSDNSIQSNHHEYIHKLHQGQDAEFNRRYAETREKYFGELGKAEPDPEAS